MTDDLKERLRGLDTIGGIGPMAAARITDLESRLAAAEVDRDTAREYAAQARIRENKAEDARVSAVDRATRAEAGEDALAEVLRDRDGGVHDEDCRSHRLNMGMFAQSCNCGHEDALAALAAYEARRG